MAHFTNFATFFVPNLFCSAISAKLILQRDFRSKFILRRDGVQNLFCDGFKNTPSIIRQRLSLLTHNNRNYQ